MPWVEALLRGQRVLARASQDGSLIDEEGRVEIRYKPKDGKAYRAAAKNLEVPAGAKVLPDDACGAAEPVAKKSAAEVAEAKRERFAKASEPSKGWVAWTDGACTGNPGPAGAGYLVVSPDGGGRREGYEYLGIATNNIGELTAILRALEGIPDGADDVLVYTDSKYAIGVLTKGWKAKANQELVERTKTLVKARRARVEYVPGHSGIPDNEKADELARRAIETRASRGLA